LQNYIKLLMVITITFITYSCSNDKKPHEENDKLTPRTEEVKNKKTEIEDSETVEKYDFRRSNWGMPMEEVMESEENEPELKSENTLDYSVFTMGMQTKIGYTFKDDELIRAGIFFQTKPETKNEYVDTYYKIQAELIKVNGKPVIDAVKQKDPSKKIDPNNRGLAACNGDIIYASQWDLSATDIQLVLRGESSECILTILYLSEEGMRQMLTDSVNKKKQGS